MSKFFNIFNSETLKVESFIFLATLSAACLAWSGRSFNIWKKALAVCQAKSGDINLVNLAKVQNISASVNQACFPSLTNLTNCSEYWLIVHTHKSNVAAKAFIT